MEICPDCKGEGIIIIGWNDEFENIESPCDRCGGLGAIGVPTTIYLQIGEILDEVTWCVDKIYDTDLEYTLCRLSKPDADAEEFKTPNDNRILERDDTSNRNDQ